MTSTITSFRISSSIIPHPTKHGLNRFLLPQAFTHPHLKPIGLGGLTLRSKNLSILPFAASQDNSPSDEEIEKEENNLRQGGKESQEAWEQALAYFKEHALKLQSLSQEAYEVYFEKAIIVLKETAERLKIEADQARQDLTVVTKDLSKEGRQYLNAAAENSPPYVKDVVETFASAQDFDDVSKVRDFYIGIPYGGILSVGGFLNFMITGSVSALRFGVILGGVLLALSVSSLRLWKQGKANDTVLKGQAAIAGLLFSRDILLVVFQGPTFSGLVKTIISGAVAAFFMYRITNDLTPRRPNIDGEVQN